MRSRVLSWFSRRLMRAGIAAMLALLLVGGVALKSGEFFHPKPAYAAASSAVVAKRAAALCLMQGLTMGAVAGVASDVLIPIKLVQYVRKAAAVRFAVDVAAKATAAEGLEVSQATLAAYWAKNGNIVTSNAVGNCLGFTFFNLYGPLAQKMFPDDIGNPSSEADGAAYAADVAGNPSVLCQNAIGPGATLDDSGLCYNPNDQNFYSPAGAIIGPDRCAANGGAASVYDQGSGYCKDDQGQYYSPTGENAGRCVLGVPEGNGSGNCVDPSGGQKYDKDGNRLNPPQADACTEALVNGPNGNLDACSYGYVPTTTPVPATPTPVSYDGQWYGAFTSPFNYQNFILTVSGGRGTFTLLGPNTPGNPNWKGDAFTPPYSYTVIGSWDANITITASSITGLFDNSAKSLCTDSGANPVGFNFTPHDFTLQFVPTGAIDYGGSVNLTETIYMGGDVPNHCVDGSTTSTTFTIYRR